MFASGRVGSIGSPFAFQTLSAKIGYTLQIRLGTRQSPLARWQADYIASRIRQLNIEVEMVPIVTSGDVKAGPLGEGGGVGLFTKEIQRALLDGRCDLAVHSLKDLPTEPIQGLALAGVPEREDVGDALISRDGSLLAELPYGARIGTGSARRVAQLKALRPDLRMLDIRGNVDTRLKKLDEGEYDAIVLALAGLKRLKLDHRITEKLDVDDVLPAVGQAALGLETRFDDCPIIDIVEAISHYPSHQAVLAERAMLRALRGGCLAPVAAHAVLEGELLILKARAMALDGSSRAQTTVTGRADQPFEIGLRAADLLEIGGARDMIENARTTA
jgi:hydroxymethylbilane synthase